MPNAFLLVSDEFARDAAILRHFEKHRVATDNKLCALTTFPTKKDWGMDLWAGHPDVEYFTHLAADIRAAENEHIFALVTLFREDNPLYPWTAQFKGLKPGKLVARFIGEIGDPYLQTTGKHKPPRQKEPITEPRVRTFNELKHLVGVAPMGGKIPMHIGHLQNSFKDRARTRLWLITDQLVKQHDSTYYPIFTAGVIKYAREEYRGVDKKGVPWNDARFAVVGRKRARILVGVAFLEGLYREARRLHEES